MIFKKRNEDHTLLNPLHSLLTSKDDNQPTNQLATIMINHVFSSTSSAAASTKRVSSTTVDSVAVDMPSVIEEGREEEAEKRDDNNIEFSRKTSYNANTERDNVEIQRQPTISSGLDHFLSYTKTLWHESPDNIEIPNIQRSTSQIVPASSLSNYSLEARSKLQRIQSVNVEKVELGLLNEQIGCLAVDDDGNDYGDVTLLPSLDKKSTVTTTAATGLKKKKKRRRSTHNTAAAASGTSLKHMFIKKKRYTTKKDSTKKKVGSSKTSAAASSRLPLISESPLGFEVGGDDLSNVKPVDKKKSNKKTKVSVDIRESPLGFELVGDGSAVKDIKKTTAVNTSPSSKGMKKKQKKLSTMKKKTTEESIVDDSTRGGYKLQLDLPKMEKKTSRLRLNHIVRLQSLNRMRTRSLRRIATEQGLLRFKASESLVSEESSVEVTLDTEDEIEHVDIVKDKRKNNNKKKSKRSKKGKKKSSRRKRKSKSRLHNQDDTNVDLLNEVERFLDQSGNVLANWGDKLLGFSSEEEEGSTSSIDMSEKDKEQVTPPLSSSSLTPPSAITDRKVSFVDNLARAIADIMASETLAERSSKYQSFGLWGSEKEKKSQTLLLDEGMIVPQEILDSLVEETDEEDSYVSSTKGVEDLSEEETLIDESMLSGESTLLPKEESIVDDSTRGGYKLQFDLPKMEKRTSRLRLNHIVRLQSLNRMRTRSLRRIATEQGLLRFKASESLVSEESSVEVTLDTEDEIEHVDIVKDKRKNNNKKKSKRSKKGKKKSSRRKRKSKSRLHNQDDTNVDLLNEVERFLDQSGNVLADWGDKLVGFSSEEETLGEETLGSLPIL